MSEKQRVEKLMAVHRRHQDDKVKLICEINRLRKEVIRLKAVIGVEREIERTQKAYECSEKDIDQAEGLFNIGGIKGTYISEGNE